MPFVYWPKNILPFEIPRVWFFNRYVEILFISSLIFNLKKLYQRKVDFSMVLLLTIFLIVIFISSVLGVDFLKSYFGNYYRADGLKTLTHLIAFSFFLILFFEKTWWRSLVNTLSFSSFFISLWQFFSGLKNWGQATSISFGHPNFLAGFLLCCLPFLFSLWQNSQNFKSRLFWSMALFTQISALILTQSRAAYLGLILFFVFLFMQKIKWPKIIFFLILLAALTNAYYWDFQTQSKLSEERRERIFTKGLLAFTQRPILGYGWTNFDYAFESVNWPLKVKLNEDVAVDKAHSHLLEILVTTGFVGFCLYLFIIAKVIKNLKNPVLFLAFLLFLYHSQTTVISISEEIFFLANSGVIFNRKLAVFRFKTDFDMSAVAKRLVSRGAAAT